MVLLISAPKLAQAQSTLTLSTIFPFDIQRLKPPRLEATWKYHQSPFSLTVSSLLTHQGWSETKLSFECKTATLEANTKAQFAFQDFQKAETQLKLNLKDRLAFEGNAQIGSQGLQSGLLKLRLGPNALHISSSAKLVPTGLADERIALNFSRALAQGDLSGSTAFDRKGFREQTLTASSSLTDEWNLSMTSTLTLQGLQSQAFELSTRGERWTLSGSFTVASQGLTSGSISLDGALAELLVQISLDFSGLAWTGLQAMTSGSLGPLSLNLIAMLSPEGPQMVDLDLGGALWGWQAQVGLEILWAELSDIDLRIEVSMSGRVWGFGVESKFEAKPGDFFNVFFKVQRTVLHWDWTLNLEFSREGFDSGSFTLARSWKF